jgi:hypothetical protein
MKKEAAVMIASFTSVTAVNSASKDPALGAPLGSACALSIGEIISRHLRLIAAKKPRSKRHCGAQPERLSVKNAGRQRMLRQREQDERLMVLKP